MKINFVILVVLILGIQHISAQTVSQETVSLQNAYGWANDHYPLVKDTDLIDEIEKLNLDIIKKDGLPKISLNGVGQLQTENVEFPTGNQTLAAPLETYNVYVHAEYNLYDGGKKSAEKELQKASSAVERNSLKVQKQSIKERVNVLFFAINLTKKQQQIIETSIADLEANLASLQAGYDNGTILESEVSKLKVRLLELETSRIDLRVNLQAYLDMLGHLTGKTLSQNVQFIVAETSLGSTNLDITRPEQDLFQSQQSLIAAQEASIATSLQPKISLFAQGGVGNPNPVNFSDFNTSPYALGGIKLQWNFLDFGKSKKQKQVLKVQQQQIAIDQEIFLFDVTSEAKEVVQNMAALKEKIINDAKIVALQKEILQQSRAQLTNGVINSSEYITQTNALIASEQNLEFNKIKLQQEKVAYLMLLGKL